MHDLIGLVAVNVCFLVCGYGVLTAARRPFSPADAGLAFCAGLGGLSLVACLVGLAGHAAGVAFVLAVSAVTAAPVVARARAWRPRRPYVGAGAAAVGALVAVYAALLLRGAYVKPLNEWDAWAIWTVKAKAIISLGDLGKAVLVGVWPSYPPLVPMMQSLVFRFLGSTDSRVIHVQYALLLIALAAAVWRILAQRASPLLGACGALAVLMVPGLRADGIDAQADLPVAAFTGLAAIFLVLWLVDRETGQLVLFGTFAALAAWTKDEGSALVLALGVVGALACARPRARLMLAPLSAAAAALALTLPWRIWTMVHHLGSQTPVGHGLRPGYVAGRLGTAGIVSGNFLHHLGNPLNWFAAPYALVALSIVMLARGWVRLGVFSLVVPVVQFAIFVWAYTIRNDPLGIHWLLQTSASRTTSSIGLVMVLLVLFQVTMLLGTRRPQYGTI